MTPVVAGAVFAVALGLGAGIYYATRPKQLAPPSPPPAPKVDKLLEPGDVYTSVAAYIPASGLWQTVLEGWNLGSGAPYMEAAQWNTTVYGFTWTSANGWSRSAPITPTTPDVAA